MGKLGTHILEACCKRDTKTQHIDGARWMGTRSRTKQRRKPIRNEYNGKTTWRDPSSVLLFQMMVGVVGLGTFPWGRLLGIYRVGAFAVHLSLGNYRLEMFTSELSFGIVGLGNLLLSTVIWKQSLANNHVFCFNRDLSLWRYCLGSFD